MKLLDSWPFMISKLKEKPTICDADFFWFLSQNLIKNLDMMKNGKFWVLTPNKREFTNLLSKLNNFQFDMKLIDQMFYFVDLAIKKNDFEIKLDVKIDDRLLKFENLNNLENQIQNREGEKSNNNKKKLLEFQFSEAVKKIKSSIKHIGNLNENIKIYTLNELGKVNEI